ncbi:hypothetical protein Psi01_75450 [Planobispora siamensis]|uniref:Amine oxidase domain-containing protein n=1 Tax=Planobispora siamensis TaxID=936338 RepID=A0A8J3SP80_9ACTN|nr:hypothetical protein [Planobispora siamensis]GIH96915.1 hypothetical protein Psi01_75450 [Planobispora siamensis]
MHKRLLGSRDGGQAGRGAERWTVDALNVSGGRITGATARGPGGASRAIEADWFIVSMPSEQAAKLTSPAVVAADPKPADIAKLRQDWMNGLMSFLKKGLPLTPGHVNCMDSGRAVTSIGQAQFWDRDFRLHRVRRRHGPRLPVHDHLGLVHGRELQRQEGQGLHAPGGGRRDVGADQGPPQRRRQDRPHRRHAALPVPRPGHRRLRDRGRDQRRAAVHPAPRLGLPNEFDVLDTRWP